MHNTGVGVQVPEQGYTCPNHTPKSLYDYAGCWADKLKVFRKLGCDRFIMIIAATTLNQASKEETQGGWRQAGKKVFLSDSLDSGKNHLHLLAA